MLNQTFHPAEARRTNKNFCLRRHAERGFTATLHLERKHAAESAHLPRRDFVTGMRGQSRIMHNFHARMIGQPGRDLERVFRMRAHPPRECLHAAVHEPAIER